MCCSKCVLGRFVRVKCDVWKSFSCQCLAHGKHMIEVNWFYYAQSLEYMCISFPSSLLSSFSTTNISWTPALHQSLSMLGWTGSRAPCVCTPGTSRAGHEILQRVNPQVTRSQINSAPPNMSQSSLVTACWTGGSSLALISPASVLRQAAIFHLLRTDDPGVREMKAPFNRSARDLAGKEGDDQSAAPSLPGQARSTCFRGHQACFLLSSAWGIRSQGQVPGTGSGWQWAQSFAPRKSQAGGGAWRPYLHKVSQDALLQPCPGRDSRMGVQFQLWAGRGWGAYLWEPCWERDRNDSYSAGVYILGSTCLPTRHNVFNSLKSEEKKNRYRNVFIFLSSEKYFKTNYF